MKALCIERFAPHNVKGQADLPLLFSQAQGSSFAKALQPVPIPFLKLVLVHDSRVDAMCYDVAPFEVETFGVLA
jgi:hypothetical protein